MSKPLNLREAAKFLGIAEGTLYNLVSRKKIPSYKPMGLLIFKQEELEDFIFRNRQAADYELYEKADEILNAGR
jgi:excisionase family DNA binding protein